MDQKDHIDELFEKVEQKKCTLTQAVQEIAVCIQTDYRLFSIAKYDEDIRASIVLEFIRIGYKVFERYNPDYGSFHNYVISYVKGLAQTQSKKFAITAIKAKVCVLQGIDSFPSEEEKHDFTLNIHNTFNGPYALPKPSGTLPKINLKDFMKKKNPDPNAKTAVILALKACFDVSDFEIGLLCREYNIDEDDFYSAIQEMKESLEEKAKYREAYEMSRNAAFFNHRRYSPEISNYKDSSEPLQNTYRIRYENSTNLWKKRTLALKRGRFHYSPTNKKLSKRLGICERQIGYYISKAKKMYGEGIEGLDELCTKDD